MAESCRARIDRLRRSRRSATNPAGAARDEWVRELVDLSGECGQDLAAAARVEISRESELDEGWLNAIVDVLARTGHREAPALVRAALRSRGTLLKEDYVAMLEDLDVSGVEAELVTILRDGLESRREDIAVTIRALHAARASGAAASVEPYVRDADRTVRGLAVAFLYDLDEEGEIGAPAIGALLEHETDVDILEQCIGAVDLWDHRAAAPALRKIAADAMWPGSLRGEAADVASRLEMQGGQG